MEALTMLINKDFLPNFFASEYASIWVICYDENVLLNLFSCIQKVDNLLKKCSRPRKLLSGVLTENRIKIRFEGWCMWLRKKILLICVLLLHGIYLALNRKFNTFKIFIFICIPRTPRQRRWIHEWILFLHWNQHGYSHQEFLCSTEMSINQ